MSFDFVYTPSATSDARCGELTTPHGVIQTPAFIFCGTRATVKGISMHALHQMGIQVILANTYHLMLRPGADHVEAMGGLHAFANWRGPMLTDSGGFQIFSLSGVSLQDEIKGAGHKRPKTGLVKITEEGAHFKSYYDGSQHFLSPERAIAIQRQLGADLVVVLDECTPFSNDKTYVEASMNMSHRWAVRCQHAFAAADDGKQALYGIIHGGIYPDLRAESAAFNNTMPYFGHAIGGSLGKDQAQMYDIVACAMQHNRKDRPVHLLGIGQVRDIFRGVRLGIDTFDCVHPTRIARHGSALVKAAYRITSKEHINLRNSIYKSDQNPLESDCACTTCAHHSRAYLHYLFSVGEITATTLVTVHNVYFMHALMQEIRRGIQSNTLQDVEKRWLG